MCADRKCNNLSYKVVRQLGIDNFTYEFGVLECILYIILTLNFLIKIEVK